MYQIDNSTAATTQPASTAAGTAGYFTDGNPATSTPATIVPAEWLNAVMMELVNVVTGAGLTLSKSTFTQVLSAIKRIGQNTVVLADTGAVNAYTATNSTPLAAGTWVDGVVQAVKIAHTNTGASTYAPDGLTPIPIYGLGAQPLQGGELVLNGTAILMRATVAGVNSGNPIAVLMECFGGAQQISAGSYGVTPPQFDNTTKLSTTAFLKSAGFQFSGVSGLTSGRAIVAADMGKVLVINAASLSFSLPLANSVPSGTTVTFFVYNNTFLPTFTTTGSDTISIGNGATVSSLPIKTSGHVTLISEGSSNVWEAYGSAVIDKTIGFAASLGSSGYAKLPSGLIIEWGTGSVNGSGDMPVTFPLAMSGAPYLVTAISGSNTNVAYATSSSSSTGFTIPFYVTSNGAKSSGGFGAQWFAVGTA